MTTCCSKDMLFNSRTVMLLGSVRSTDTGSVSSGERTSSFAPKGAAMVFKVSGLCKDGEQMKRKEKKDYVFRRQFIEKPSVILGCPGSQSAGDRVLYTDQNRMTPSLMLVG